MDIQYGLPRLSQKSCKRLNQAAQRSSQSAFISSSTKGTQNQVVQTSHTRVSKRSRSINNLPKEHGASSSTKGNENQAEQTPLTRVSKRSQSINSLRKEQRASGQLPCLSQKHSDAVNRLTQRYYQLHFNFSFHYSLLLCECLLSYMHCMQ